MPGLTLTALLPKFPQIREALTVQGRIEHSVCQLKIDITLRMAAGPAPDIHTAECPPPGPLAVGAKFNTDVMLRVAALNSIIQP